MIKKVSNHLWVVEKKLSFFALEMGTRMTIVDYSGKGDLWVHSPINPTDEIISEIGKIGNVRYVVAPNKWHHLFLKDFKEKFPEAKYYCSPGLEDKRSDFTFDGVLSDNETYPWTETIQQAFIQGAKLFNEFVFYHKPSKTLIVTDLGIHICENSPFVTRIIFKLMGMLNRYGWSKLEKKFFISDSEQFHRSISKVLEWDFDKITLAHGEIIHKEGQEHFRHAFL